MELIFLEPEFKEKIWGGKKLKEDFNFDIPSDNTGEAWVISGHKNGITKVRSPKKYKGIGLDELYRTHRELFFSEDSLKKCENKIGSSVSSDVINESFPLLIKILDANDRLSVQVHPNDEYARIHEGEGEQGKNECWYILDAKAGAEIVYGHNASTKKEFVQMIEKGDYDKLLRKVKVKKGDFFDVPSGTIHAIGAGITILETQQSSDTTYRVYDYDRVDKNNKKRELHIKQSIDVSTVPHINPGFRKEISELDGGKVTKLVSNKYFTVKKIEVDGSLKLELPVEYLLFTVIEGNGQLDFESKIYNIKKGDSFIATYGFKKMIITGNCEIIESNYNCN